MRTGSWIRSSLLCGSAIALIALLAYIPAMRAGYVWDDNFYLTRNPLITSPDGLKRIWFSLDSPSQYFPLVYTTFRIEHAIWGLNPLGYHLVNILLHITNALLIFYLLRRLKIPGAWLAAAIFAVHPVHVESVAWVTERKNVLSTLFYLLSVTAWLRFVDGKKLHPWKSYGLVLIMSALALSAKTTACTLPVALLLVVWLRGERITWKRVTQTLPVAFMGLAMGLVSIWWERFHQGTRGPEFAFGAVDRLLIASRALWFYLGKLIWPVNLTFSYPRWRIDSGDPLQYLWLIACLGAVIALWRWRRSLGRGPVAAAVFFAAALAPMLGFVSLYTFRYSFVADHYQYLASVGPIALLAAGAAKLWQARGALRGPLTALSLAALLVLGALTSRQACAYRNQQTLWLDTLAKNPSSWMACVNLGNDLLAKHKPDQAIAWYHRSLRLKPDQMEAHYNLGAALAEQKRIPEALSEFAQALKIDPRCADAHNKLGVVLARQGKLDEAVAHFTEALHLDPWNREAHYNLGLAFARQGKFSDAIAHYRSALEIDPQDAETHYNLAAALIEQGDTEEAIAQLREVLRIDPDDAPAHDSLGNLLMAQGDTDEAETHFSESLRSNPRNAQAHNNLGRLLAARGELDQAIMHFRQAVSIEPDYALAQFNLALALYQKGDYPQAMRHALLARKQGFKLPPGFLEAVRSRMGSR